MTMLLVHGAWHGAWCWQGITPRLEAAGVNVIAPDLPGHGTDSTPRNQVTLDAYADRVIAAISGRPDPITLVGHSMGGVVISAVAERVPERIARLIYACAFLPRDGEALGQLGAEDTGSALNAIIGRGSEPGTVSVDAAQAAGVFYQDCEAGDVANALAQLTPQPTAPLQTAISLSEERFGRCPRDYVLCTNDRAVTPEMQRTLLRRSPCERVVEFASGHSPFMAQPDAFADVLLNLYGSPA